MSDALFDTSPYTTAAVAGDYDTWLAAVWPAFEQAADSGVPFTAYGVAKGADLPEPPDPAHHWGRLLTLLQERGVIRKHGWTTSGRPTSHASGVRTWVGVPRVELGAA